MLQAPYYGMHAANMSWTLTPMLERVMASVSLFKARARKLLVNVPGGKDPTTKRFILTT